MSTWQTIDTAPTDGTEVDLWMHDSLSDINWRETDCFYEDGQWLTESDDGDNFVLSSDRIGPTHWMHVAAGPSA